MKQDTFFVDIVDFVVFVVVVFVVDIEVFVVIVVFAVDIVELFVVGIFVVLRLSLTAPQLCSSPAGCTGRASFRDIVRVVHVHIALCIQGH